VKRSKIIRKLVRLVTDDVHRCGDVSSVSVGGKCYIGSGRMGPRRLPS